MPLVRISTKPRTAEERRAIGDAVYVAMRETLNVPENDRFQIITEHSGEDLIYDPSYLGIARTAGIVFIQVFLRRGRSVEMKQAFYRRTAELLHANVGIRSEDVLITLSENDAPDWSFGNGIAQYV
ncbi:tautomerase family protein [Edaphobacter acidisoli]|uniref:Tautomerase family protein n=1 Tax=Edaphobacter acidisoli TaxID=2040573 RepID=A0A916RFE8_9BACT|nr:tautomerase family protein [Edaphobacter acidisoli]GGA54094.1 tautomerase family protein [Edaphobacter acidisoli]